MKVFSLMAQKTSLTLKAYLEHVLRQCRDFQEKVGIAASKLNISNVDRKRRDALLGLKGCSSHIPLSDMTARMESISIFSRRVRRYFEANLKPDTLVLFGTFIDDVGLTTDQEAIFRLKRLRGKVARIIRKHKFDAIIVMEVQVVTNYAPRGKGNALLLHAHAIMWRKSPSRRKLQKIRRDMNASPTWTNHFGAKTIMLKRIKAGLDEIEKVAIYLQKLPYSAKWRRMVAKDKFRFRQGFDGYHHRTALRVMEGLSHYSIRDAVFCVGDGKHIRKEWIAELEGWHRNRLFMSPPIPDFDTAEFWQRVRGDNNHNGRYHPFVIE